MKMSEAIRLGAMIRPQCFGSIRKQIRLGFLGLFGEKTYASCALGAAFEAAKCPSVPSVSDGTDVDFRGLSAKAGETIEVIQTPSEWWGLGRSIAQCPECGRSECIDRLIPHLNDKHRWSREAIADLVERHEKLLEPTHETSLQIFEPTRR